MAEKYKIIIDTNFIWQDSGPLDRIMNSNPKEMLDFIKENKIDKDVSIHIPQVVLEERMMHQLEEIGRVTSSIEAGIKRLSVFGVKKNNAHKKSFRKLIEKNLLKELNTLNISIIPIPKIKHEKILQRALNRVKPFSKKDKGYKDTLIWFSILKSAELDKNTNVIFCTNNSDDFDMAVLESEFNAISKKQIIVLETPQDVKEFLDKSFSLSLDLKALHKSIIDEIKTNHLGDIMSFLNIDIENSDNNLLLKSLYGYRSVDLNRPIYSFSGANSKEDIVGYNFKKIDIKNISGTSPVYIIEADVQVEVRFKDTNDSGSPFALPKIVSRSRVFRGFDTLESISIIGTYDSKNKTLSLQRNQKLYWSL